MTVQMQARSSSNGQLYTWNSETADFAGAGFPGPGSPLDPAISVHTPAAAGAGGGSPAALRATWCLRDNCTFTGATAGDPGGTIQGEPGVFSALQVGDTLFVPPMFAVGPPFHGGSPAPEFAGIYTVLTAGTDEIGVARDTRFASALQVAATAIITADQGAGAGVYQVATPASAVFNVDPQVMPQIAKPPPDSVDTYTLESQGGMLRWQLGSVNAP